MSRWAAILRVAAVVAVVEASAPAPVFAAEADPAAAAALNAERTRLRAQLDRVNAEIDALKRAGGVRDDYKLRTRLADAESLARRLVEIDARLGLRAGSSKAVSAPVAAPTDGPADLDAKADILADQARRMRAQADTFGKRAQDIKGRQELRRRAADLDRDPFAPMETSKRRVASAATAALPNVGSGPRPGNQNPVGPSTEGNSQPPPGGFTQPPPTGSTPGITAGGSQTGRNNDGLVPTPSLTPGQATVDPTRTGTDKLQDMSLAAQLRDLLDTATLADIRRLEANRTPSSSAQALERAAIALRDRATELENRARTMRAKPATK
jgi:hypothetical protein